MTDQDIANTIASGTPHISLATKTCQYIIGDTSMTKAPNFCGKPSVPGKAWCKEHYKIVYPNVQK